MKFHVPILTVLEEATQDGLRDGMKQMLERSDELAPELDGAMAAGGFVQVDDLTGQVGYKTLAGYPYVVDQHEDLTLNHPRGGQAKFLETASEEVDVSAAIAKRVRGAFGG